jgi:hypothetical protein
MSVPSLGNDYVDPNTGSRVYKETEEDPGVNAGFRTNGNPVFGLDEQTTRELTFTVGECITPGPYSSGTLEAIKNKILPARGVALRFSQMNVPDVYGDDIPGRFFGLVPGGQPGQARMAIIFQDPSGENFNYEVMFGEGIHGSSGGPLEESKRVWVERDSLPQIWHVYHHQDLDGVTSPAYVRKITSRGKYEVVEDGYCPFEVDLKIECRDNCPVPE